MSSILNSISAGELQVQQIPEVNPVKEDSIIDLLQNSEIEFKTCPEPNNNLKNFNTGFGAGNDLHFESLCKKPDLKTPLYQENYLREFVSEEEKAAARNALGLANKDDVVIMSLLTAEDSLPNEEDWNKYTIKQLRKGDRFFTPVTSFKSVYNSKGVTLDSEIQEIHSLIILQQKDFLKITKESNEIEISSLGDVTKFLQGFNNGDNLKNTLDIMDQEMLRFEKIDEIIK